MEPGFDASAACVVRLGADHEVASALPASRLASAGLLDPEHLHAERCDGISKLAAARGRSLCRVDSGPQRQDVRSREPEAPHRGRGVLRSQSGGGMLILHVGLVELARPVYQAERGDGLRSTPSPWQTRSPEESGSGDEFFQADLRREVAVLFYYVLWGVGVGPHVSAG